MTKVLDGSASSSRARSSPVPRAGCCSAISAPTWSRSSSPAAAIRSAPSRAASTARTSRPTTATSAASRSTRRTLTIAPSLTRSSARRDVYIQNFRPGFAEQARRGRGAPARAQPAPGLRLDQRLRRDRPGGGTAGVRHGRAGGERVPEAPRQPRESARRRAGDRRCIDRLLCCLWRAGRARRARPHRNRPNGRGVDARGDGALQPRRVHALLPGRRGHGPVQPASVSQSYVLECGDGKWIALHMSSPEKFWQGLAQAIEEPDTCSPTRASPTREARIDHQEALIDLLGANFRTRSRDQWCERLERLDVPHAPMYDTSEALHDPQAVHLQLIAQAEHPVMGDLSHRALAGLVRRRARPRRDGPADARRARRRDSGAKPQNQPERRQP